MTTVDPAAVYATVLFGGFFALCLPVALLAYAVDGVTSLGFRRALALVLVGEAAVYGTAFVLSGGGNGVGAALVVVAAAYLPLSLGLALLAARTATVFDADAVARRATGGWVVAQGVALAGAVAAPALGVDPFGLLVSTPALFGLAGLSGFAALMAGVGLVGGAAARRASRRLASPASLR